MSFVQTQKTSRKTKIIDGELELWCNKCEEFFPATTEFFYRDKNQKSGFRACCKACYHDYPSIIKRDNIHKLSMVEL